MLEKNKAFNTTGEFITLEGKELESAKNTKGGKVRWKQHSP